MPITNSGGVVLQTPSLDFDQFRLTGVHRADEFALCHQYDRFRQFQWDLTNATAGGVITFAAGAAGSLTLTLPTSSGTLALTGGGGGNSFTVMQPITGTSPTASSSSDTLTFTSSDSSVQIIGNSGTKTLDFKAPLGTVTTASVVSANGFAGSVATPTTTPAITLSTSITGILKGNGTAISAAVSGTDYAPAQGGLYKAYVGNGSSTIHWDVTSTTKADFVATGVPAFTETTKSGFSTAGITSGPLPGVTFTAPITGNVRVQISTAAGILVSNNASFYLTDGSGNILDAATVHEAAANAPGSVTLSAFAAVTATTSYTFKLMAAAPSGAVSLGASASMTYLLSVEAHYV